MYFPKGNFTCRIPATTKQAISKAPEDESYPGSRLGNWRILPV